MQPVQQVRYQGIAPSPELRESVERHATRLERFHERIAACRVALERWYQHHGQGSNYRVEIDLELPGEALAVSRDSGLSAGPETLESTLSAAFDSAEGALELRATGAVPPESHAPRLSAEARRLHPLHGRAPEDERQTAAANDW